MVEDHLPGGLEALNENLNTTNFGLAMYDSAADYYDDSYYFQWEKYGYNYKDIYGDRVVFFITDFNAGTHTLTYLARAMFTGQFQALPAEVSAMYDLGIWGHSGSTLFTIGP